MKKSSEHRPIAACAVHEAEVRRCFEEADLCLDDEAWLRLDEVINCPNCQWILATMTGDHTFFGEDSSIFEEVRRPSEPMRPGESFINRDEEVAAAVKNVRVWPQMDNRSNMGRGPLFIVSDNKPHIEIVGMFDPAKPEHFVPRASCLTVMWKFSPRVNYASALSLPVDEMAFFLLQGELEWRFAGGAAVQLGVSQREQLLWASGDPTGATGLPPLNVHVTSDEPAIGVAKFYGWEGIPYTVEPRGKITLDGEKWDDTRIELYWQAIDKYVHQMANRSPFTASLPSSERDFATFMESKGSKYRKDPHQNAREAGQLIDADIPGWPVGNSDPAQFKTSRLQTDGPARRHPMLDFRLLKLSGDSYSLGADRIQAAHHHGYETIVPLIGAIRCGWVELTPGQRDFPSGTLDEFGAPREDFARSASRPDELPQILLLCSEIAHGFTAGDKRDTYALLIRCFDYHEPRSRERGIIRSSSSTIAPVLRKRHGSRGGSR